MLEIKNTEIQHLQSLNEQANFEKSEAVISKQKFEEKYKDIDSSFTKLLTEFDTLRAELEASKKTDELQKGEIKQLRQENKNYKDRR